MAFRNPVTSLPASSITGVIQGSQLAADAIDGKTITGALIRSAESANRVEIASTPFGGFAEIDFFTETESDVPGNVVAYGVGSGRALAIGAPSSASAVDVPQIFLQYTSPAETTSQIQLSGSTVDATGAFTAGNLRAGRVTITPSAANVPTSVTVTGLDLNLSGGKTARAMATAVSTLIGTAVLGVACTGATADAVTVWVTRTNTTPTGVDYLVYGA
jgi:hypothetical protein